VREDLDFVTNPVIADISATDSDAGPNGVVRYSITGGNDRSTFAIDAVTGRLSVLRRLDYEQEKGYYLSVRAQDGGTPPKSNSTTVNVRVIDVNDNDPRFYTLIYQESVSENLAIGTTILRVQAYDADSGINGKLTYSMLPADTPIAIDANTGAIIVVGELDREKKGSYRLTVDACDLGDPARTATAIVDITIRDVNDNGPVFNPKVRIEKVYD